MIANTISYSASTGLGATSIHLGDGPLALASSPRAARVAHVRTVPRLRCRLGLDLATPFFASVDQGGQRRVRTPAFGSGHATRSARRLCADGTRADRTDSTLCGRAGGLARGHDP
jgi:hypothetical protein